MRRKMSLWSVYAWVRVSPLTLWREVIEQVGSSVKWFCIWGLFSFAVIVKLVVGKTTPPPSLPAPSPLLPGCYVKLGLFIYPHASACPGMKGPVSLCDGVWLTLNKWVWCSSIIASLNTAYALLLLPLQSISAITHFLSKKA